MNHDRSFAITSGDDFWCSFGDGSASVTGVRLVRPQRPVLDVDELEHRIPLACEIRSYVHGRTRGIGEVDWAQDAAAHVIRTSTQRAGRGLAS